MADYMHRRTASWMQTVAAVTPRTHQSSSLHSVRCKGTAAAPSSCSSVLGCWLHDTFYVQPVPTLAPFTASPLISPQVVCQGTVANDVRIRVQSFTCLHEIAANYYNRLPPYMQVRVPTVCVHSSGRKLHRRHA